MTSGEFETVEANFLLPKTKNKSSISRLVKASPGLAEARLGWTGPDPGLVILSWAVLGHKHLHS